MSDQKIISPFDSSEFGIEFEDAGTGLILRQFVDTSKWYENKSEEKTMKFPKRNPFVNPRNMTVAPIDSAKTIWGHDISDLQTDLFAGNGKIVGTLHKVTTGTLARDWGEGYFMGLQFGGPAFKEAIAIYVGMDPSVGSGMVNVLPDPDKNGIFKVTNKIQHFKIVVDYGMHVEEYLYDLSDLTLSDE